MNNNVSLMLGRGIQYVVSLLLWTGPLSLLAQANSYTRSFAETTSLSTYFPRDPALRRCFVTSPQNCIFSEEVIERDRAQLPSIAVELSLDYRQAAFLAEVSAQLAALGEYEQAYELIQLIGYALPRAAALTEIASLQARAQQEEASLATLNEALRVIQRGSMHPPIRARALTNIAMQYESMGNPAVAAQLFEIALQPEQFSNGSTFYSLLYQQTALIVAVGLLETGRLSQAEQLVSTVLQRPQSERIQSKEVRPLLPRFSPRPQVTPYELLKPLFDAGKHDFVIQVAQAVEDSAYRTQWLSNICVDLKAKQEYDRVAQVRELLQSRDSGNLEIENQTALSSSQPTYDPVQDQAYNRERCFSESQNPQIESADRVMEMIANGDLASAAIMASAMPSAHQQMLALTEVAISYIDKGDLNQFNQLISEALIIADTIDQDDFNASYGRGFGRMQIVARIAESAYFDRALFLSETIEEDSYKILSLIHIAEQYKQADRAQDAQNLLGSVVETVLDLQCTACL